MVGDHINPWWLGGKTVSENLQMLCSKCNGVKGGKSNN
jgi:5-methylcytosine-specific restriction endonuclease McrA